MSGCVLVTNECVCVCVCIRDSCPVHYTLEDLLYVELAHWLSNPAPESRWGQWTPRSTSSLWDAGRFGPSESSFSRTDVQPAAAEETGSGI